MMTHNISNYRSYHFSKIIPRLNLANPLAQYFINNKEIAMLKYPQFFDAYAESLSSFVGKPITYVQVGVQNGGDLVLRREHLGKEARIIGIDIDKKINDLKQYPQFKSIELRIGDQGDPAFWSNFLEEVNPIHVFLDDGGHTMQQQIITFEMVFPKIVAGGVYIIEDLHTSYMDNYGGGLKKEGTFIEFSKDLIDSIHAQYIGAYSNKYSYKIRKMVVQDSLIWFEKADLAKTTLITTGNITVVAESKPDEELISKLKEELKLYEEEEEGSFSHNDFVSQEEIKKELAVLQDMLFSLTSKVENNTCVAIAQEEEIKKELAALQDMLFSLTSKAETNPCVAIAQEEDVSKWINLGVGAIGVAIGVAGTLAYARHSDFSELVPSCLGDNSI